MAADAAIGDRLAGRYRLDALLGAGGMGAVYAAFDESLRRRVAVKLVKRDLVGDASAIERFLQEGRALAALSHPGVVTVFDCGIDDAGPFLVMEMLEGEPLSDVLARGPLGADAAIDLGAALLDALEAAHASGVVHRDVKPANVFVRGKGGPKLIDFGIAGAAFLARDVRLTDSNAAVGTPIYMAPEQLRGERAHPAADVYAVGATLYEALSGGPPHPASTPAVLVLHKLTEPARPLASVAPGVPRELGAAIDRALRIEAAERWPSAAAMRDALLAARSDEPIARTGETAATPVSGSAAPIAVAATLPSTPLPVAAIPSTSSSGPRPAASSSSTPSSTPSPSPPAPATPLAVEAARPESARSGRARWTIPIAGLVALAAIAIAWRQAQPAVAPPEVGLRAVALYHDRTGSESAMLSSPELWASAAADFERVAGASTRWAAAARLCRGQEARVRGDFDAAERELRAAIETDDAWAPPHCALAGVLTVRERWDDALAETRRAEQLEPTWWVPIATAGTIYSARDDLPTAVQEYRRALVLAPDTPVLQADLAQALHAMHLDDEAGRIAEAAIARDPDLVRARVVLAERALERGDAEEALTHATRAASIAPRSTTGHVIHAEAAAALGRTEEAWAAIEAAEAIARTIPPSERLAERLARVRARLEGGASDGAPSADGIAGAPAAGTGAEEAGVEAAAGSGAGATDAEGAADGARGTGAERTRPGGGGGGTDLDSLLEGVLSGRTHPEDDRSGGGGGGGGGSSAPDAPSRSDVLDAMRGAQDEIAERCRADEHGVATARVTFVGSTGAVSVVVVTGAVEGTPVASCIARAVRAARVPPFARPAMTVTYPFRY